MAIKDIFTINRRTFFDPRAWLNYDELKRQTLYLYDLIKPIFAKPTPPEITETFEEAVKRQELTEEDVLEAKKIYFFYALLFFILGIFSFLFGFYLLIVHYSIAGWFLSFAITGLFLAQAFRFHFWYFQIKFRKLGCTFAEWRRGKPFSSDEETPP